MSNRNLKILNISTTLIMLIATGLVFFYAPQEREMGEVQRIFYFHVGSAWTAGVAFLIAFVASIAFLMRRNQKWDWLGVSSTEVGLAYCTVVLITGPIWAKPVWGIWWTWDARLTLTFVVWLMYITYLLLRTLVEDPERRGVLAAVFNIFAFLAVPIDYMAIRLWRTQHPQPVIAGGEGSGLDPTMWRVLLLTWAALLALMVTLVRQRYKLEALRHETEEMALAVESLEGKEGGR